MSRAYVLEHAAEAERLERQALRPAYDIARDLAGIHLDPGAALIDLGCGSGLSCRHLTQRFPEATIDGCDASEQRLAQAAALIGSGLNVRFFPSDLEDIDSPPQRYDYAVARFVLEHVEDPLACAKEAFRVLKPGGKLLVIEFDGQIFNLFPMSDSLSRKRDEIVPVLPVNLCIGREIPSLLRRAGFEDLRWEVEVHDFQGPELAAERELSAERIQFAWPALVQILGSEERAEELRREYLDQLRQPGTVLFYNKFRVTGTKPL